MSRTSLIPDFDQRVRWLRRFRREIAIHADELVRLLDEELHKPGFEALTSDIMPLLSSCRWHEKRARRLLRDRRIPGTPLWLLGVRARHCRRPIGRVAIIATWNYPVHLLGVQLIQAVLGGNRVIVKPNERSPRTQALLLSLACAAGLSESDLAWTEATHEAGAELVAHEPFDHLVFTGSTTVGRMIACDLAQRLIPSTLELSGNDTAVVLASADLRLAARTLWYALTLNHGQTCMVPRRVLVDPGVYDRFLDAMRDAATDARPRRLIDEAATDTYRRVAGEAIEAGGRLIAGDPNASKLVPIIIADCPADSALYRGEHFGPVLPIAPLTDEPDAWNKHGPLTLSVFGSTGEAEKLAEATNAGSVFVNDSVIPTGHPGIAVSAGGRSGWGATQGASGLLAMTKPVCVSTTSTWFRLPPDPPGVPVARLTRWVRRLYAGRARSSFTEGGAS